MLEQQSEALDELNRLAVEFFMLADRAEVIQGKLYLMGGAWDRQYVVDFAQPVLVSFAIGIRVPWNATNREHRLRITVETADGQMVNNFALEAGFAAGRPAVAQPGESQRVVVAIPLVGIVFPGAGMYFGKAAINGELSQSIEFHLMAAPPGARPL